MLPLLLETVVLLLLAAWEVGTTSPTISVVTGDDKTVVGTVSEIGDAGISTDTSKFLGEIEP